MNSQLLKVQRDISFEDVILSLESGKLLDDIEHPNKEKYPNQNIFIIWSLMLKMKLQYF